MICKPDQSGRNFEKRLSVLTAKEKQLKVSFKLFVAKVASACFYQNIATYKVWD
jgi:hypothetical protein